MNELLALVAAARFARKAHKGQTRKQGTPYFGHPMAVARILYNNGYRSLSVLQAAYLHDVLEDCPVRPYELRSVASADAIAIVQAVTKRKGEPRSEYLARIAAAGPLAIALKKADQFHNNGEVKLLPAGHPTVAKMAVKTAALVAAFGQIEYASA